MKKQHLSLVSSPDKPKRAALYIRVSTQHQIDKESLDFQRQDLINYCQYALNITEYTVFEDAGYSAKSTARPQYQEMMAAMRRGEYSHMIVWKLDRISRNLRDFTDMWDELRELNISFVSRQEQFDTSTAIGEAMLRIIIVFAELERKMTSERVTGVMMARASRGDWNGARMPLGYAWDAEAKRVIIDETESKTVKLIYDEYERLNSSQRVARHLYDHKIATKRGGIWGSKTVVDILRNPLYSGTLRYNYRMAGRGKKKPSDEVIYTPNAVPAIIDETQWNRVQERMNNNISGSSSRRKTHIHALSGLCRCRKCGARGVAGRQTRPHKGGYHPSNYRCGNYAHRGGCQSRQLSGLYAEPFVLEYIRSLISPHSFPLAAFKERYDIALINAPERTSLGEYGDDDATADENLPVNKHLAQYEDLKKQKKKIEQALLRLDDIYYFSDEEHNAMSKAQYIAKRSDWQTQLEAIDDKMAAVGTHITPTHTAKMSALSRMAVVMKISEHEVIRPVLPYLDKEMLAQFIQSMLQEIVMIDNRIKSIKFRGNDDEHVFLYNEEAAE